jgi:hypothetical protein
MKRIVLFVLLILGISSANAQISYGILAGLGHASIRSSADDNAVEKKFFPSWRAGVTADIPVAGRFHLQPQLLVSTKGSKAELHNLDSSRYSMSDIYSKDRLVYLELPVNMLYKHPLRSGRLVVGAGPYIAYGLGGKSSGTVIYRSGSRSEVERDLKFKNVRAPSAEDRGKYEYFKPLDAGLNFIAGYEFNNGLCFHLNYSLGLTGISPSDGVAPDGTEYRYNINKNGYFGITAGYMFCKRK